MNVTVLSTLTEFAAASELLGRVWNAGPSDVMTAELLRALAHGGNYVAGAWDDDALVGAAAGWFGHDDRGWYVHSHITGVAPEYQNRGVGVDLKFHQRAWAAQRDIDRVVWTFDPLVRRNAVFNLRKLGARIVAYEPDFYGPMHDPVNLGDASDRCIVEWSEPVDNGVDEPPPLALDVDDRGWPREVACTDDRVGVSLPHDIVSLRRDERDAANAWRFAVRRVMGDRMANGYAVAGITKDGTYVLERADR